MANINQLSSVSSLQGGDNLVVWDTSNGDSRKASVTTLMTYVNENVTTVTQNTQYAAPAATGFSITVNSGNIWLIVTPVSAYAAGGIVLPAGTDKDTVTVNCTAAVTSLSVTSSATVSGAPTTLAADDFFTMRYDGSNSTWYRIG